MNYKKIVALASALVICGTYVNGGIISEVIPNSIVASATSGQISVSSTVKFNATGGTIDGLTLSGDTYSYDSTKSVSSLPVPKAPANSNLAFAGWFAGDGTRIADETGTPIDVDTLAEDTTYYANWNYGSTEEGNTVSGMLYKNFKMTQSEWNEKYNEMYQYLMSRYNENSDDYAEDTFSEYIDDYHFNYYVYCYNESEQKFCCEYYEFEYNAEDDDDDPKSQSTTYYDSYENYLEEYVPKYLKKYDDDSEYKDYLFDIYGSSNINESGEPSYDVQTTYSSYHWSLYYTYNGISNPDYSNYKMYSFDMNTSATYQLDKSGIYVTPIMQFTNISGKVSATAEDNKFVKVTYIIQNRGSSTVSNIGVAQACDVQIANNDDAPINAYDKNGNVITKNSTNTSVSNVIMEDGEGNILDLTLNDNANCWWGHYRDRHDNAFSNYTNSLYSSTAYDSGISYSWDGITLNSNASITRSVIFAVGNVNLLYDLYNVHLKDDEFTNNNGTYTNTLVANTGYNLPDKITVKIDNAPTTDYEYNSTTGEIIVNNISDGEIKVIASGVPKDIITSDTYTINVNYNKETTINVDDLISKLVTNANDVLGISSINIDNLPYDLDLDDNGENIVGTPSEIGTIKVLVTLTARNGATKDTYITFNTLSNVTTEGNVSATVTNFTPDEDYPTYTIKLSCSTGYSLPASIEVYMGDSETPLTSEEYTYSNGTVTIPDVDGDIKIVANATTNKYAIQTDLTNITSSNTKTSATYGTKYETTLTADEGYTLPKDITITMGSKTLVVDEDYTYVDGVLTIPRVTGKVVITATAEKIEETTTPEVTEETTTSTEETTNSEETTPTETKTPEETTPTETDTTKETTSTETNIPEITTTSKDVTTTPKETTVSDKTTNTNDYVQVDVPNNVIVSDTPVKIGEEYRATLSTNDGFPEVIEVKVNGTLLSTSQYTYVDGELIIPAEYVTGDITIDVKSVDETTTVTTLDDNPSTTVLWGDIDCNNEVDARDVLLLKKYLLQMVTDQEVGTQGLSNADVTHDDEVTAPDLVKLKKYILTMITQDDLAVTGA